MARIWTLVSWIRRRGEAVFPGMRFVWTGNVSAFARRGAGRSYRNEACGVSRRQRPRRKIRVERGSWGSSSWWHEKHGDVCAEPCSSRGRTYRIRRWFVLRTTPHTPPINKTQIRGSFRPRPLSGLEIKPNGSFLPQPKGGVSSSRIVEHRGSRGTRRLRSRFR